MENFDALIALGKAFLDALAGKNDRGAVIPECPYRGSIDGFPPKTAGMTILFIHSGSPGQGPFGAPCRPDRGRTRAPAQTRRGPRFRSSVQKAAPAGDRYNTRPPAGG